MPKNNKGAQILKGVISGIKGYSDVMAERQKIMAELIGNELKAQSNWVYKQKELDYQSPYQKKLGQMYEQQYGQPTEEVSDQEVFGMPVKPNVRIGEKGYDVNYPSAKEFFFGQIQSKKKAGAPLTEKETEFEKNYLGIGKEKSTSAFEIHQQLKNTLNSKILQEGPEGLTPSEKFILGYKDPKSPVKSYSEAFNQLKVEALNQVDKVGYDGLSESQKIILNYKPAKDFTPSFVDKMKGKMTRFKNTMGEPGRNDSVSDFKNQLIDDIILPEAGPNWETDAPELKQYLDELYPEKGAGMEDITLPPIITTTSRAVKWLMDSYSMSKDEAVEWIKENQ